MHVSSLCLYLSGRHTVPTQMAGTLQIGSLRSGRRTPAAALLTSRFNGGLKRPAGMPIVRIPQSGTKITVDLLSDSRTLRPGDCPKILGRAESETSGSITLGPRNLRGK